jgi:hypothetical protein
MKDVELASIVLICWALADSEPSSGESKAQGYTSFRVRSNALASDQSFRLYSGDGITWKSISVNADTDSLKVYAGSVSSASNFRVRIGSEEVVFAKSGQRFTVQGPNSITVSVTPSGSNRVELTFSDGTKHLFEIST